MKELRYGREELPQECWGGTPLPLPSTPSGWLGAIPRFVDPLLDPISAIPLKPPQKGVLGRGGQNWVGIWRRNGRRVKIGSKSGQNRVKNGSKSGQNRVRDPF